MAAENDLFKHLNNAVLDLQASTYQTYERPLRSLARLLDHADVRATNESLIKGVDLDKFLEAAEATQGGMIGSASLPWPDDPGQTLGLSLLLVRRFAENPSQLLHFGHQYYHSGSKLDGSLQGVVRHLIIPFVRDYKSYVMGRDEGNLRLVREQSSRVFIVHGHDGEARESAARFIESVGLEAIILHEQANRGQTIIEKVEANSDVGFAVVLLTPDDEGCARGEKPQPRARQNVVLELGYFIGLLGRERVCALKKGSVEIPSDFLGVVWTDMDSAGQWKNALGRELDAVGYDIDWNAVMGKKARR